MAGNDGKILRFTGLELHEIMKVSKKKFLQQRFSYLKDYLKDKLKCSQDDVEFKKSLNLFLRSYSKYWINCNRFEKKFMEKYKWWLNNIFKFNTYQTGKSGRPCQEFNTYSDRTKRLKTEKVRSNSLSVLAYATEKKLRSVGNKKGATILKNIVDRPIMAMQYETALAKTNSLISSDEALGMVIDGQLSRFKYNIVRSKAPQTFPSYKCVQQAKKYCYPTNINVSERCASVPLQNLLDHTTLRILMTVCDKKLESIQNKELILFTKWGFDGTTGHTQYKQAYLDSNNSDSHVLITTIVPLQLCFRDKIIWKNTKPSSTGFCRPLNIQYVKESKDVIIKEKQEIDRQIVNLNTTNLTINNINLTVKHELQLTMVDVKICNTITNTNYTQSCFICKAPSKDFNNIEKMLNLPTANIEYGLSILHAWIKCYECILHLAYRLTSKKRLAKGDCKISLEANKKGIQDEFKEECGLHIDKPKPGSGNYNDGNTARRFFQNYEITARITKVDVEIIKNIYIILAVLSGNYKIKIKEFKIFCTKTAKLFVEKYNWFWMSPTLHKILIHSSEIVQNSKLNVADMSEEAQEATNKIFKKTREQNSRKCSREKNLEDIFNFLLVNSEPFITSKRTFPLKKSQRLPEDALILVYSNQK